MQAFNRAYLTHINEFTGIAYKDDPAVVALLLTNENDLSQHFGNALLANKGVPLHDTLFATDAKQFSKAHNLSYDKTIRTWEMGGYGFPCIVSIESCSFDPFSKSSNAPFSHSSGAFCPRRGFKLVR